VYLDDVTVVGARYTITFDANGGTVAQETGMTGEVRTSPASLRTLVLPTPSRDGYAFNGWFTAAVGGTAVTAATEFNANATVYAQWTENTNTYDVTWNADGGTPAPTQSSVNHGGNITAPAEMTKTGYTFDSWYTNSGLTSVAMFPIENVTENTTLYAKWTIDSYAVIWNDDGGSPIPNQESVTHGGSITEPTAMTKAGNDFGGWYRDAALTVPATFPITNVMTNTMLYAKWTVDPDVVAKNAVVELLAGTGQTSLGFIEVPPDGEAGAPIKYQIDLEAASDLVGATVLDISAFVKELNENPIATRSNAETRLADYAAQLATAIEDKANLLNLNVTVTFDETSGNYAAPTKGEKGVLGNNGIGTGTDGHYDFVIKVRRKE